MTRYFCSRAPGRSLSLALSLAACSPAVSTSPLPTPAVAEPAPIQAGIAPPPGPYAPGFDAVHYDISLVLPDTGTFIRGQTTAHIRLEGTRPDTLVLDFTGLAVDAVEVGQRPVVFRHADGTLRIPVPADRRPGDTLQVRVSYQGHPDDGLILRRNVHGEWTAFADNWPNRARFWFPSIDHPSDKASVRFTIRDESNRRMVIANGTREESTDRSVWRWVNEDPIPTYTMVIGAAPFAVRRVGTGCPVPSGQRAEGCPEVTTWLYPQDTARAAPSFRRADQMVSFYSRLIAPFPYAKLAHVQAATRFGGMENVSAIFYSEEALSEGKDIEETVAHETAHQWFGDAVTEADWHHLWLSEGITTYFGALFFEHTDGVPRFREIMERDRQAYVGSEVAGRPMVDTAERDLFELLNPNSYEKGAWVMHMLRGLVGDSAFFAGMRSYYREHGHGTALTGDLQAALEAASERDLSEFFQQWVFRPGYPQYRAHWSWRAGARGAGTAEIVVEQVQPVDWPTFRMPLVLEFATANGPVRHTADVRERRTVVRVPLPARPTELRIDPDGWVLKEVEGVREQR
jgi:aminopeptidase N